MRRGNLIWGIIIIFVGILLLLDNLNILPPNINVWTLIWPMALILLGLWFLVGPRLWGNRQLEVEQVAIPLESARQADVVVEHGAGRLDILTENAPGQLLSGSFRGGVEREVQRNGDRLAVRLHPDFDFPFVGPWGGATGFDWRFGLSPEVELSLTLKTGAGESRVDLSQLRATHVRLETGASSTYLTLPANAGFSHVEVHAGAARVEIRLPQNVAARIHVQSGLSGVDVDTARFPRSGDVYLSPGYDTAPNRAEIRVETGVGSIDIR
jgi:hypothetical protein